MNLTEDEIKELIKDAFDAREMAYTPYSNFKVGAALLTSNKKIYKGCNIENASFSPTICAERTAIFKAVSEGNRDFCAISIVGGKVNDTNFNYSPPCGVCRQVMVEFCDIEKFMIIIAKSIDEYKIYTLKDLLPISFSNKELESQ